MSKPVGVRVLGVLASASAPCPELGEAVDSTADLRDLPLLDELTEQLFGGRNACVLAYGDYTCRQLLCAPGAVRQACVRVCRAPPTSTCRGAGRTGLRGASGQRRR